MNKREAPPPGMWGRSRTGDSTFRIRRCSSRNARGQKLYRLGFLGFGDGPVWSGQLWTLDELVAAGVRFMRRAPRRLGPRPGEDDG